MPRTDAAATSIVLNPAPARTMSARRPASMIASVTLVERTTSTSACVSPSAAASAASLSAGSYTTSQPMAARPSRPDRSNWSATRTLTVLRSIRRVTARRTLDSIEPPAAYGLALDAVCPRYGRWRTR